MQFGQVITQIHYQVDRFAENESIDSVTLEHYLNEKAKEGWLLHTIRQVDTNEYRTIYDCIWQKFVNIQQGIIS